MSRVDAELRRTGPVAPHSAPGDGPAGPSQTTCAVRDGSAEPPSRPESVGVAGVPPADLRPCLVAAAELVCSAVEPPVHAPAADVVVHVGVGALTRAAGPAHDPPAGRPTGCGERLDDGPGLRDSTLAQLLCDARIQLSVDGPDGRTVDLGRRRRRPSTRQLDALWRRDRGCAAPGCDRTRYLHAHHVVAWARGGRTDLDNLVLLCGEHHRALHAGAFTVVALGRQRFRFHGPQGAVRAPAPATTGDARALADAHAGVVPSTIEPDWDGSPLHLQEAVAAIMATS